MARLKRNESVILVSNETVDAWRALHDSSLRALSDDEQEVDMARIDKKIGALLNESAAAHVILPVYNETEDGSWIDYLGGLIHKARLAPYRAELLELLESWQSGEERISAPLNRIEELIDDEVLDPDVLVNARGDYEHYRYD